MESNPVIFLAGHSPNSHFPAKLAPAVEFCVNMSRGFAYVSSPGAEKHCDPGFSKLRFAIIDIERWAEKFTYTIYPP
jgi:hypothetical protein